MPNQAETLLHSLEWAAAGIGLHVNAHKTEYMCYNQTGNIATLDRASLKLVDKFTYLGSSVSSTEKDIDTRLTKAWTAIDRLSIIWKSDLTDKMKRSFFQAAVGHQLYGHLPPITKTIQVRWIRHAGHCWRSKDELISDVLLWTPTYGCAKAGWSARTYIQQLCEDTGCNSEDLPEAMNDREKWRERVRDIRAGGTTWWWWYIYICVCVCVCVVHSISFQTFFVQAFKIVIDSWKFTMLLLYILWDEWPIFMISASNEQLQQQLEYTLLKPDCHCWWISKCNLDVRTL